MPSLRRALVASSLALAIVFPSSAVAEAAAPIHTRSTTSPRSRVVSSAPSSAPAPAAAAGYTSSALSSEFSDLSEIDLTGTGVAGKEWYTDRAWDPALPARDLSVSNGVLTLAQSDDNGPNLGIQTASTRNSNGRSFRFGYFESRIRFDPKDFSGAVGWPSFWMMSAEHFRGTNDVLWGEIDIAEMYHEPNQAFPSLWSGNLWSHSPTRNAPAGFDNTRTLPQVDWSQWHTYGALWQPGKVTWYLDGRAVTSYAYDRTSTLGQALEGGSQGQSLILGTGRGLPIQVDWVRVWR